MNLGDELRLLKSQILTPEEGEEAFQTWTGVKNDLTTEQRVNILTAWNTYLRTNREDVVIEQFNQIIRSLEE